MNDGVQKRPLGSLDDLEHAGSLNDDGGVRFNFRRAKRCRAKPRRLDTLRALWSPSNFGWGLEGAFFALG